MPRIPLSRALPGSVLLLAWAAAAAAQPVEEQLRPRGEMFFELDGTSQLMHALYHPTDAGQLPIGGPFFVPELGTGQIPELEAPEIRFRALAGEPDAPGLRIGATRGRFSAESQTLPLGLSYGILDRLTVGVTVPFVQRRVDAQLRHIPEGANVGLNPAGTAAGDVDSFLSDADDALRELRTRVSQVCGEGGAGTPDCRDGEALVEDAERFLQELGSAYEEEILFPLDGSQLGTLVGDRWNGIRTRMTAWDAPGPETLPLAPEPLDDAAFRSRILGVAWPSAGFPLEPPDPVLEMGDVELHVVVGLLDVGARDEAVEGVRLRSSLRATVRLPTGVPDSLRAVAPLDPPRGVGGTELRWVSDLLLPSRFAVLAVVEGGRHGTTEMPLLAPDGNRLFSPGQTRTRVRWTPGSFVRMSFTPRFQVGPALSLGAGWSIVKRGGDAFEPVEEDGPDLPAPDTGPTVHSLALELRYSAMHAPMREAVPFPFELFARVTRSVGGDGDWAPVERRVQAGARLRIRSF